MPLSKCAGWSSVFKIYHFQNLPAKDVTFSRERRPIGDIFQRFRNVSESYECSLTLLAEKHFFAWFRS